MAQKNKKEFVGVVTSNKMNKAVVVKVKFRYPHPLYQKVITRYKKFYARTDIELNEGDKVVIRESRPLSKLIRWVVIQKLS